MDEQKPLLRKLLEEAQSGIVGNAAWYVLVLALGFIVTLLLVIRSWILGTAIPAVLGALSTKVVLTVSIIILITITPLMLGLAIIWSLFARKRRLEAREHRQAIAELNQRIAELERHKKDLLGIQKADHDRLNKQTTEISELQSRLREQTIFKAIYYDSDYRESWIKNPEAIAKFFDDRGFKVMNALQLGHWIDERMEHDESCRSLLVFAQDIVPDTVADLRSDTCKLRMFLNNGGRVVWHGDVPFWYQGRPGRRHEIWMGDGPALVLGVRTILLDRPLEGILTEKGRMWGMVLPGPAQRAVPIQEVDDVFTVGPPIDGTDTACAWRKIYNPHFPHSGFLQHWPGSRDGRDASINTDYFRFAVSGWSAAPRIELPEIEVPKPSPQVFLSNSKHDKFREIGSDSWKPAVVYAEPWHEHWQKVANDLIACGAKWIWIRDRVTDDEAKKGCKVFHKRDFDVHEVFSSKSSHAEIVLHIDDEAIISVNQKQLGTYKKWNQRIDLTPYLKPGTNTLTMELSNHAHSGSTPELNPTGIIYKLIISY